MARHAASWPPRHGVVHHVSTWPTHGCIRWPRCRNVARHPFRSLVSDRSYPWRAIPTTINPMPRQESSQPCTTRSGGSRLVTRTAASAATRTARRRSVTSPPRSHRHAAGATISSGFELPGGEALGVHVHDLRVVADRDELDLQLHLVAMDRQIADGAGHPASSPSPRSVRAASWKFSTLDGRAGLLTQTVVGHRRGDDEHGRHTVYLWRAPYRR